MNFKRKKALILLSGGIDSGVLLWWAKSRGWKAATLGLKFPGRRKMELAASRKLARMSLCKENFEVEIPFIDPPKASLGCYIPKRNLMYYGLAASLAEKIRAEIVLGGHIRHDGMVFRDARPNYLKAIERLANAESKIKKIRFLFPFIRMEKKDIIRLGKKLRVPFHLTWSCSRDGKKHCWKCNSCKERLGGFRDAGVPDPLSPFKV